MGEPGAGVGRLLARWPLRRSVPFAILLLTLLVGGFGYWIGYLGERDFTRRQLLRGDGIAVRAASIHIQHHLRDGDRRALEMTVRAMASDPDIGDVAVIDKNLDIVADAAGTAAGAPVDLAQFPGVTPQRLRSEGTLQLADAARMISVAPWVEGDANGWILLRRDLGESLAELRERMVREATQTALASIAALALFWWGFELVFRRRLERLRAAIQLASDGELGVRVALDGSDEIAGIAQAFNRTMAGLETDRARLLMREQEVRDRNRNLRSLRLALDEHAIVSVTDASGNIIFANERFCEISGYSRQELVGQNHRLVNSGKHGLEFFADMWGTIRSGRVWEGLIQNRRKDGSLYWVQSTIVPNRDDDGLIQQFISIRTDVTRRERLRLGMEMLAGAEPGEDLFRRLTEAVSLGLDAKWVGICRLEAGAKALEVLALWSCGEAGPTFRMDASTTPCAATVVHQGLHVHSSGLAAEFAIPKMLAEAGADSYRGHPIVDANGSPLGVVWAIDDKPAEAHEDDALLLAMAARRAAAEIQRSETNREIERHRERLDAVVEGAQLGVWDWDIDHDYMYFNDRFATMLGYAPGELEPGPTAWSGLIHPDDYEMATEAVAAHRLGNTPSYTTEHRLRAKDGSWVWVLDRGQVTQRDETGRATRMAGVHIDITERKQAEIALREERARFDLLIRAGNIGFWEWDLLAEHTRVASLLAERMALEPGKHTDVREWLGLIHPDDYPRFIAAGNQLLKGTISYFRMEARFRAIDGWRSQLIGGQVVERNENGRALRVMGTHVDVTELREAQASLVENEQRLLLLVEAARLGYWDLDLETGSSIVNERVMTFVGEQRADHRFEREEWGRFFHPDDLPRMIEALDAHCAGATPYFEMELRLRAADGHWGWFLSAGQVATRNAEGKPTRAVGLFQDISDRREAALQRERLEHQLQQAQKMDALGKLTGGIAHDFNNILASILGFTSLAQAQVVAGGTEGRMGEYLGAVMAAAERARELVTKMLAFSRNAPREDLQEVDPAPLLAEVARMMESIIPSSIELSLELPAAPVAALLDPSDLHQLLVNLIVNARDALGEQHGRVGVSLKAPRHVRGVCSACHVEMDDLYVEIEVADSGAGIDPAILSRIFDPFFTTKAAGKGTGMGLSVVHGVMHRGRGHVLVESVPGQGARFRLFFPPAREVGQAEPAPASEATPPPGQEQGGGQRLLLVDDEPMVLSFLAELFRMNGYTVDTAGDGVEALSLLRQDPKAYRLLLTDQTMPRMTGTELSLKLRELRPDLPIVLCTGFSDSVNEQTAQALGIRYFLNKPVAPEKLVATVALALAAA